MPELFVIGGVGAFVTFLLANFNLYIVHRSFSAPKLKILQGNLSRINWYWSIDQGAPILIDEGQKTESMAETDYQKATRGAFIFGTMMIFLSWLGLAILSLYMFSIYKLAKNRVEEKVMSSDLANIELQDLNELRRLLKEKADLPGMS